MKESALNWGIYKHNILLNNKQNLIFSNVCLSLIACPSAVALEVSRESNGPLTPVCPPMPTAGLTYIRVTLSQPEVATSVLVRLYKPRDSININLSQIRLLGTTAFGEIKTSPNDTIDEEQLTKTR